MAEKYRSSANWVAGKQKVKPAEATTVHTSSPVLWKDKSFIDKLFTATKGLISGDAVIYGAKKKKGK
jgi:hypothetical protein